MLRPIPTPDHARTLHTVRSICRDTGRPARTVRIADADRYPHSTTRARLVQLHKLGFVRRVGARSGWLPAIPFEEEEALLAAIRSICRDTGRPARTIAVAARCTYLARDARRRLQYLERIGLVERVGVRRGWLIPAPAAAVPSRPADARASRPPAALQLPLPLAIAV